MHGGFIDLLQQLAPIAGSLMVLAALVVLWQRDRSPWLGVAIAAELAGLAFRGLLMIAPERARDTPLFFAVWTLTALVFGGALLGYALETTRRK
ncbi:MAG TPA: hypothetical protein VHC92_09750 [Rhodanobacteraceae bacterium]|jgi:hypothetical protein|nr:hypothetical protein [Rhodanobacteraceae bacterium]